jgi:hypothetical protein
MGSKHLVALAGLGLSVLVGCGGSPDDGSASADQHLETKTPAAPATPAPAKSPTTVDCTGTRNAMQDHDVISLDINNDSDPACSVSNKVMGAKEIKQFCNDDDFCAFRGHVSSQEKNLFVIDQILGPISE